MAKSEKHSSLVQRDQARVDARTGSAAVQDLHDQAAKRAAAATVARTHQQRADHTLSLQPSKPADLCASMQAIGDEWLQGRAKP